MADRQYEFYNFYSDIEEFFVVRRGKHLTLSALDWTLMQSWRDMGIPLHVALRGIDRSMGAFEAKKGRPSLVNSLFYCHQAVAEEFEAYLASRAGARDEGEPAGEAAAEEASPAGTPGEAADVQGVALTALRLLSAYEEELARLRETREDGLLREVVDRVRERLLALRAEIVEARSADLEKVDRDLRRLDDLLMSELEKDIPAEERMAIAAACRSELRHYRKNLPKETYDKILANFVRKKSRERFGLTDLSLLQT